MCKPYAADVEENDFRTVHAEDSPIYLGVHLPRAGKNISQTALIKSRMPGLVVMCQVMLLEKLVGCLPRV